MFLLSSLEIDIQTSPVSYLGALSSPTINLLVIDEDRFSIFKFDHSKPRRSIIDITYSGMVSPYIGLCKKTEVSSWDI